jgi:hypothetical protein
MYIYRSIVPSECLHTKNRPFAKLPLTIPGAHDVHFSIHLQPRDQHPVIYIIAVPGPLFILSPRGTFFFLPWSGMHAPLHAYQIYAHIIESLQVLFTLDIWFLCVQVLDHHWHNPFRYLLSTGMYSFPLYHTCISSHTL